MIPTTRCVGPLAAAVALASIVLCTGLASAIDFPGPDPGPARAAIEGETITLENNVLKFAWSTAGGRLRPKEFVDKLNGQTLSLAGSECCQIVEDASPSAEPRIVHASGVALVDKPRISAAVSRLGGKEVGAELGLGFWHAVLLDGSNYITQTLDCWERTGQQEIVWWDLAAENLQLLGTVNGCPAAVGSIFFATASPLATNVILESKSPAERMQRLRSSGSIDPVLLHQRDSTIGSVIGVAPKGQLRRAFLYYLERERAHPYRPFLHYNNGSEIGCEYWRKRFHKDDVGAEQFRMKQESLWLTNIRAIGDELVKKRNVKVDAFVHDFEWDDETLVWQFHRGYPEGFSPAVAAAKEYGAKVGVWFSPWGGYPCQPARVKFGREMGFETSPGGLSLAGPRYYRRFSAACANMIEKFDANYFKFDGFAAGNNQSGPGPYATDAEALLRLAQELRWLHADVHTTGGSLFINATTGSWPSPFWLLYVDSIWRQGSDTGLLGKGPERQRWITYRDNEVYHRIVKQSPLFPLNSLMIHGVFVNKLPLSGNPYDPKNPPPSVVPKDVIDEIHTFFGTGTNCQEMYINPTLMTAELWDALAEAANWSRRNSDVLVDTHWIGGDPAKGEIYGYASWSKRQGIFTLRNPDDKPAQIAFDLGQAFELPAGAPTRYSLKSPWKRDAARPAIEVAAGKPHTFTLEPFQVLVFEATPVQAAK